ncbi:YdcF family protein [Flavobacterium algicola]|uniref:YdcF family protein n=1 Tax=Flavobacterium algicola TaxID=556529 RepID=UPI001EFE89AF|nr:YdcF family protein [Flavobacterium algicola]MCG9793538.1 YdcF family protein [Flavobacterium algicola]
MKNIIPILIFFMTLILNAQVKKQFDVNYKLASSKSIVQDKNFYLLTAIQNNVEVKSLLENDSELKGFYDRQHENIEQNLRRNSNSVENLVTSYQFEKEDLTSIAKRLEFLLQKHQFFRDFVNHDLRVSGKYENFNKYSDAIFLNKAWDICASSLNRIVNIYGNGEKPQYAAIDSVSYDVQSDYYKGAVFMWSDFLLHKKSRESHLFFETTLDFSMSLLYFNHRDEAARYEPLAENENKKAITSLKNIDFNQFDYSAILVLGNGPENYNDRLSAIGKLNLQLGVLEYKTHKAPFIIVSGGYAHPFRAPFCEAIEMKKELMNVYHIPEENILIEPHARHTTTNLRNASRLLILNQIPITKPILVVTNSIHSSYLGNDSFAARCMSELGYLPAEKLKRISNTAVEFLPNISSLHQNPIDPLDP